MMAKENIDPYHQSSASSSVSPTPTKQEVDNDALVLELVQAKTAEAVAKQEAEEAKAKLESLRKMLNLGNLGKWRWSSYHPASTESQSGR